MCLEAGSLEEAASSATRDAPISGEGWCRTDRTIGPVDMRWECRYVPVRRCHYCRRMADGHVWTAEELETELLDVCAERLRDPQAVQREQRTQRMVPR